MSRLAPLALAAVLASGCALSPGLHVSDVGEGARGAGSPVEVVNVTPKLLVEQAQERARAAASREKDPSAASAEPYQYRVAPLDVLSVTVWDHPELTIPAGEFRAADIAGNPIAADGTMFYPHVGVLQVAGLTIAQIRDLLTTRLRKVIESPQLDVRVVSFRGKRVQVTGDVVKPSTLPVTDVPLRVQDAIAAAGGLTPNAWTRGVTLTRDGKVHRLDLQALYDQGDLSQNWLLRDGDVLHVPSREENKVYVMGEVRQPSSRVMARGRMSLAEALGDSNGLDPTSASGELWVFRGSYERPRMFRLDAKSADALLLAVQFQLEPQDVVYVATYGLTNWNRVVTQILPTIQGVWQAADLANRGVTAVQGIR